MLSKIRPRRAVVPRRCSNSLHALYGGARHVVNGARQIQDAQVQNRRPLPSRKPSYRQGFIVARPGNTRHLHATLTTTTHTKTKTNRPEQRSAKLAAVRARNPPETIS